MKVKISMAKSPDRRVASAPVKEPVLTHSASCSHPALVPFSEYLGKLGVSAIRRQQEMTIAPPLTQKPAPAERSLLTRAISWLNGNCATPKRLRVLETVTLGDKRLVAVIQADGQRFLIGGGPAGVSLLTPLDHPRSKFDQFESSQRLTELAG